jgi:hypothetical protein
MSTIPYSYLCECHFPHIFYTIKKYNVPDKIRYPLLYKKFEELGYWTSLSIEKLDTLDKYSVMKKYEELKLVENFHDYVDVIDWEN